MKTKVKPTKGIEAGVIYAMALSLVQGVIPEGVLTAGGEAWVAGGIVAVLATAYNFLKHKFRG